MINRYFFFLLVLVFPLSAAFAQLEVQNALPITPENLITNTFLGDGIEVINVTYDGAPNSVALFGNGGQYIGLERGIVMTTGEAVPNGGVGVNSNGNVQSSGSISQGLTDDDLQMIAGPDNGVNNIVRYTITFRPSADNLQFRYVFGSEEYPEYVCSGFNDIFGFFISGPGITGPFSGNSKNIALIPGTDLPVRINNVNPGVVGANGTEENCTPPAGSLAFSEYYVDNDGSTQPPIFDGYTTVLTAETEVIPCEVYTIKLVICDVGDSVFDSGVFLEAKSFGAPALEVAGVGAALDGSFSEGCGMGQLAFTLPRPAESDFPIDFEVRGTATNGADYTTIPDTLFIPAGDSALVLPLDIFEDGIVEGNETLIIEYQKDICTRDTIEINLFDRLIYEPGLPDLVELCDGDSFSLDATLDVELPEPPQFTSTTTVNISATAPNTLIYSPIEVSGVVPGRLGEGVLKSVCIDSLRHRWIDDLDIYLVNPNGRFIELTTDNGGAGGNLNGWDNYLHTCFSPTATVPITPPGTQAPGSAVPFTGTWLPEGEFSDLWTGGEQASNGTWQLLIIDDSFGLGGELYQWSICFEPSYKIEYNWSPAEGLSCTDCPNPTFAPDTSTTYTLTITDSRNCIVTEEVRVEVLPQPAEPELSCYVVTNSSVSVIWEEDPIATAYEISTDGVNFGPPSDGNIHEVSSLLEGQDVTFYVRAIGDSNCPDRLDTLVCSALDCPPPTVDLTNLAASCLGVDNGRLIVNVATGIGPFDYQLGEQQNTTGEFEGLAPGTYLLTVIGVNGCPYTQEVIIGVDEELAGSISVVSPISCQGEADGSLIVNLNNGDPPYTYVWSSGETTQTIDNKGPGDYSVDVTEGNGCSNTYFFTLIDPPALTVSIAVEAEINCNDSNDGSLRALPEGGNAPYTYDWSNGATDEVATGMGPGNFTLIITDAGGCTATASQSLVAPPVLSASVSTTERTCAAVPDGTATVDALGGTPPYTYQWDDSNNQTGQTATNLEANTYTVIVMDANGCMISVSGEIQPPPSVSVDFDKVDVLCNGANTGTIEVTASGGDGNFSYSWSDASLPNNANQVNLLAGNYTVTVTDGNGCQASVSVDITEPDALAAESEVTAVTCNGESTGAIDLTVRGGQPPYQYSWSNGTTTEDLRDVPAQSYDVIITDANGCILEYSSIVNESPVLEVSTQSIAVACFGDATGSLVSQVQGGQPPYQYAWSSGGTADLEEGLTAGNYVLTVTDAFGCAVEIQTEVSQPAAPLTAEVNWEDISCFEGQDGLISVTATGGTASYSYRLQNGNYGGNSTFLGLTAGTYTVFVQDANGCETLAGQAELTEPAEIIVDLGGNRELIWGDSLLIRPDIFSDNAIVSYSWSPVDSSWINCADCPEVLIYPEDQLSLRLFIRDEFGCTAEDLILIRVTKDFPVQVPTGFTPNGDGTNDILRVHGIPGIKILQFRVFNRWGEMLYEEGDFMTNDEFKGWDGNFRDQPMNGGAYVWQLLVEMPDGRQEKLMGESTLIR